MNISQYDWHMNLHKHAYQWMSGVAAGAAAGWKVNLQVKIMWHIKISGILRTVQWYYSQIISMTLKFGGTGQQRSSSANFQKNYFWAPMHRKSILGISGGQNQVKVTKGHQVQIFKKFIFELLCTEKAFWASQEVKIRSRSPKVIKCKFSKSLFLSL